MSRPVVMVASGDPRRGSLLSPALPGLDVRQVGDADALLREAHLTPPDVLVLYTDTPSRVPLPDLLTILRGRAELAHCRWLAVGSQGLGALLQAGSDALLSDGTPPEALAAQVKSLQNRVHQERELEERRLQLQRRMDTWEHEERVRDQLVHMLVHDLKNPISAVLGLLELVGEDDRVPEDLTELVQLAREETQHLLHLSVNMLDVRKIQAGKMRLNTEVVYTPRLIELIELARGDVGAGLRDRHVRVSIPDSCPPLCADPEILRRILVNLLSNALKHTTTGGVIGLTVRPQGSDLLFTVQDDGEGIPEDDIPNLFAAFEQSRLTLHGRFDTGMGLAFCKLAVEGHGGRIWVESVRGQGATFSFTLPIDQGDLDEDDFADLLA